MYRVIVDFDDAQDQLISLLKYEICSNFVFEWMSSASRLFRHCGLFTDGATVNAVEAACVKAR